MSVEEIETTISQLAIPEITRLTTWFEEYQADLWDKQIEADALAGRLDALGAQADQGFEYLKRILPNIELITVTGEDLAAVALPHS